MFNYVPIKHKQMSFVSNGGKFKLYTVLNGLIFSTPTQPGFHLNARYMCCNKLEQLERGSFPFLQKRKTTIPLRNNSINKVDVNVFDKMTATDVTVGFFNNLISVLPNGILDGHTYENVNLRFSKIIDFRIFVS
jgi:hypothetical protein